MPAYDRLLTGLALLLMLSAAPVSGQATPVAAGCDEPPRSWEEIEALIAMPAPPMPVRSGLLPRGEQLRVSELVLIEETVHRFITCSNAGEPLRVYALYSDDYLQRLLAYERPLIDRARYDALATPVPAAPDGGATLVEITGGRRMVDLRYGALVTIAYPSLPQPKTFFFIFRLDGERMLIDDVLGELTFSLP